MRNSHTTLALATDPSTQRMRFAHCPALRPRRIEPARPAPVRKAPIISYQEAIELLTPTPKPAPASPAPTTAEVSADTKDIYSLYLREVGRVPLLSAAEEAALARRIMAGDAAARDLMITSNLRLVIKIARQFEGYGLPLLDLTSEGNIGLMRAVDRFDPDKGARLACYAAFWIKQFVRRAVANQARTIRLPVHLVDQLARMRQVANNLQEELGRPPTDEDLSDEMNLPLAKIAKFRSASMQLASLDASLDEHGESTLGDRIADERAHSPADELEMSGEMEKLAEAMKSLSARELDVLKGRFGLGDRLEETLEEIGARSSVTRERIRQIQNKALAKLRRRMEEKPQTRNSSKAPQGTNGDV